MFKKEMIFYLKKNRFPKFKRFIGRQKIGLYQEANQGKATKQLKIRLVPIGEK